VFPNVIRYLPLCRRTKIVVSGHESAKTGYAAFRSVVSTAKANGASLLGVLRFVLAAKLTTEPLAQVG
jgi:hypothetical protein